jgi:hypothetical protein
VASLWSEWVFLHWRVFSRSAPKKSREFIFRNRVRNSYGEVTQRPLVKINYKVVVTEADGSREPMVTCTASRILRLGLRLRHYYLLLQSLNC